MIQSLLLSFFKWKGYGPWIFLGFDNYIKLFTIDKNFFVALRNSIVFTIFNTIGSLLVGFILAILINLKIRFWKIYRFVFFLPVVLSGVVVSMLWLKIVDPYGLLNTFLSILHLENLQRIWLANSGLAMGIIIAVAIWWGNGYSMIFFLAGMQNIDEEIYEAAKIDGASTMRRIVSITVPLLKNVFSTLILLTVISSFKVFDIVWIITLGGPAGGTEVLGTQLYENAFRNQRFGYASVIAVIMFLISILFSIIYIKVTANNERIRRA